MKISKTGLKRLLLALLLTVIAGISFSGCVIVPVDRDGGWHHGYWHHDRDGDDYR